MQLIKIIKELDSPINIIKKGKIKKIIMDKNFLLRKGSKHNKNCQNYQGIQLKLELETDVK